MMLADNTTGAAASGPISATESVTPLVELVALAAVNGWTVKASGSGLEWARGANRVVAKFSVSSQRPQYAGLFNYTDYERTGQPQLGTAVWRGVGNGGDRAQAHASLRRWFTQPQRELTDPTQW